MTTYPQSAHADWNPVLRFMLMGPITGALVGFAQVTVAAIIWLLHGQPDFYFRGGQGVVVSYLLYTIGGSLVGVAYGCILFIFEHFSRRRIRPIYALCLVTIFAVVTAAIVVTIEFQDRKIDWVLVPQLGAITLGLFVSLATSVARRLGEDEASLSNGG